MAYLGMVAFVVMIFSVAMLAKYLVTPKAANQTVDIADLWKKVSDNIHQKAKVDNNIMEQAIALQALDLQGAIEKNQQLQQEIYNEYYCGCRLLILNLLPEDTSQMTNDSQNNVVQFAEHFSNHSSAHNTNST